MLLETIRSLSWFGIIWFSLFTINQLKQQFNILFQVLGVLGDLTEEPLDAAASTDDPVSKAVKEPVEPNEETPKKRASLLNCQLQTLPPRGLLPVLRKRLQTSLAARNPSNLSTVQLSSSLLSWQRRLLLKSLWKPSLNLPNWSLSHAATLPQGRRTRRRCSQETSSCTRWQAGPTGLWGSLVCLQEGN